MPEVCPHCGCTFTQDEDTLIHQFKVRSFQHSGRSQRWLTAQRIGLLLSDRCKSCGQDMISFLLGNPYGILSVCTARKITKPVPHSIHSELVRDSQGRKMSKSLLETELIR